VPTTSNLGWRIQPNRPSGPAQAAAHDPPLHADTAVLPLPAVVRPAPHAMQSGLGIEALPPEDHWPTGQRSQLGPPRPAAQTLVEQAATRMAPVAEVVDPAGQFVHASLGTSTLPPAE
jgi:hypothetical protein